MTDEQKKNRVARRRTKKAVPKIIRYPQLKAQPAAVEGKLAGVLITFFGPEDQGSAEAVVADLQSLVQLGQLFLNVAAQIQGAAQVQAQAPKIIVPGFQVPADIAQLVGPRGDPRLN